MSRRKKISEKEVCDGLRRLAFGEIMNEKSDNSPTSFYEALEKSTQATKKHYMGELDE